MMHNSLLIEERLRITNQHALHRSRRDPHRFVSRLDPSLQAAAGEIALHGSWRITGAAGGAAAPAALQDAVREAAQDLAGFLACFGVEVVDEADGSSDVHIRFTADDEVAEGAYRRVVSEDASVEIAAKDAKGIWAGLIDLERTLSLRGAPFLTLGSIGRVPSWETQISQAPFGSNYLVPDLSDSCLSDDAFRMLAHAGINGMTIYGDWLLYVKSSIFPELNAEDYERHIAVLRDASERAARFGVSLFYVPVSPKLLADHPLFLRCPSARGAKLHPGIAAEPKTIHNLCSTDPDVLAFHAETMERLFREVPLLGGLILIIGGESYYHCYMRPDRRALTRGEKTNCPCCLASSPEEVVAGLLKATADAVHSVKPEAPVMAWPYSATGWSGDPAQLRLIETMEERIALLTTIDKDQWAQKEYYTKHIWDYSVDYTGPADNIVKQAEVLDQRGMDLYIKTETALGLEFIQFPYIPCLQRLAEKWSRVKELRPEGVLQSWMFFGMWGSRAEELGWWASWYPERSADEVIAAIAERDFGANASALVEAWASCSEAIGRLPYIPMYFTGPEFIGPAHPLYAADELPGRETFEALLYYLQENEETFSDTVNEVRHLLVLEEIPHRHIEEAMRADPGYDYWPLLLAEYALARDHAKQAWETVKDLKAAEGGAEQERLQEEQWLLELLYRTLETTSSTYAFLELKARYREAGDEAALRRMLSIMAREAENARSARIIYEHAPWLDLALRLDGHYPSSLGMIDAKIRLMEEELRSLGTGG
ncbi:hypothetical protein [Paenibacillus sacheonensis]|uniref:Beta-hexosaminidase bacterial type N-terminal domain-containing protein n=1 Tax=Paenibacillus sacheonensis TaxID=742054 RepID=A0A7X4YJH8_9BACL|nr:hypothetical protein [Paenibacillus sacheonensis]MBM7564254.1 hypothetical protein [Paenibacillus sacheonensis]NBC67423.1 hypothetical protein [Paenibacillus sacheonensis]